MAAAAAAINAESRAKSQAAKVCDQCRFWHTLLRQCRRHAPTVAMRTVASGTRSLTEPSSQWPITAPTDCCGDFEGKWHVVTMAGQPAKESTA